MSEIIPRIASGGKIELVNERSVPISGTDAMKPDEAMFLARALIASALALSGTNPPSPGTMPTDAAIPILSWASGPAPNGRPTMIFEILPNMRLMFELTLQGASELGSGLLGIAQGRPTQSTSRH